MKAYVSMESIANFEAISKNFLSCSNPEILRSDSLSLHFAIFLAPDPVH